MSFFQALRMNLQMHWAGFFKREESDQHAIKAAFGFLCGMGTSTITRVICFHQEQHRDWSATYKFFSESPWQEQRLFEDIAPRLVEGGYVTGKYIRIAWDDTGVPRSGRKIQSAGWMRDPMGPAFHVNLVWGQRYLQGSVLVPLYQQDGQSSPRAIPTRFVEVPAVKKPGKGAGEEKLAEYREAKKKHRLSLAGLNQFKEIREQFDEQGMEAKIIIHATDASYMNKTTLAEELDRAVLLGRTRKDACLCYPAAEGGRRVYGEEKFTPESVAKDESIPWSKAKIFHGGEYREVQYKELSGVLWQRAGKRRRLRLLVTRPVAYRTTKNGRRYYRDRAYLLCTDEKTITAEELLQTYFDRWQIEYNHRDEKDVLGVGQAQVWSAQSVRRVPTFIVASYAWMLLTALQEYGPRREEAVYEALPLWRRATKRPSCRDMIDVLRREVYDTELDWGPKLQSGADGRSMCLTSAA
jgi:hypothetical protein